MTLTAVTWARFLVWFIIGKNSIFINSFCQTWKLYLNIFFCQKGLVVYYVYGIKNSVENDQSENQMTCFPCIISKDSIRPKEANEIGTISKEVTNQNSHIYKF